MNRRRPNRLQPIRSNYSCRLAFRIAARRRQVEEETCAAVGSVFRADLTTMCFNNGTYNSQAHAHSGLLGGKEMIEHFVGAILWQAGAEIADADFRALAVQGTCTNKDAALGRRARIDRIERIHD